MPIINGVKMACASCIRGHRSTTCQHTDRPMLEVRKKGRPLTQCDHCRDLRRIRQVHVRCMCKPDESEAPKRVNKGKEKRRPLEQLTSACNCDDTGICNCAVPRTSVSKTGRQYAPDANPTKATAPLPHRISPPSLYTPVDGASSGDDTSVNTLASGSSHGPSTAIDQTPASSYIHSPSLQVPPSSVDAFTIPPPPAPLSHFTPSQSSVRSTEDSTFPSSFQLRMQVKSQRYAPYPQSMPSASMVYAPSEPSPFPEAHHRTSDADCSPPATQQPRLDDPNTVQLWNQFLLDELPSTLSSETQTSLPSTSTMRCSCDDNCTCPSCATPSNSVNHSSTTSSSTDSSPACTLSATSNAASPPTEVDCFDCGVLLAALDLVDEEVASSLTEISGLGLPQLQSLQRQAQEYLSSLSDPLPHHPMTQEQLFQFANVVAASVITPAINELSESTLPIITDTEKTNIETTTTTETNLGLKEQLSVNQLISKCGCGTDCTCVTCSGNTSDILKLPGDGCQHCSSCNDCVGLADSLSHFEQALSDPSFSNSITAALS